MSLPMPCRGYLAWPCSAQCGLDWPTLCLSPGLGLCLLLRSQDGEGKGNRAGRPQSLEVGIQVRVTLEAGYSPWEALAGATRTGSQIQTRVWTGSCL